MLQIHSIKCPCPKPEKGYCGLCEKLACFSSRPIEGDGQIPIFHDDHIILKKRFTGRIYAHSHVLDTLACFHVSGWMGDVSGTSRMRLMSRATMTKMPFQSFCTATIVTGARFLSDDTVMLWSRMYIAFCIRIATRFITKRVELSFSRRPTVLSSAFRDDGILQFACNKITSAAIRDFMGSGIAEALSSLAFSVFLVSRCSQANLLQRLSEYIHSIHV